MVADGRQFLLMQAALHSTTTYRNLPLDVQLASCLKISFRVYPWPVHSATSCCWDFLQWRRIEGALGELGQPGPSSQQVHLSKLF